MKSLPYLIIISPAIVAFALVNRVGDAVGSVRRSPGAGPRTRNAI